MRGHENVVEVAVFVPPISLPAVRDLVARVSARRPSLRDRFVRLVTYVTDLI